MSCLHILEIKPLSVVLFANIFSQSVGCLFIFFMVSFAMQKLISLIRSYLFIFYFTPIDSESDLRNINMIYVKESFAYDLF